MQTAERSYTLYVKRVYVLLFFILFTIFTITIVHMSRFILKNICLVFQGSLIFCLHNSVFVSNVTPNLPPA